MRRRFPKYLLEKHQLTGTLTFAVLFAVVFLNLYIPFSDTAWFRLGNSVFFLFTAGFIAISILFMIASKVLMYKTRNLFQMTYLHYVLWCVAEVVIICLFYTFVTFDVIHPEDMSVLQVFLKAFLYGSISLLIPYSLSAMYFMISERDKTIRLVHCKDIVPQGSAQAAQSAGQPSGSGAAEGREDSRISFFDNNGALKLCVLLSDLCYIESDDNYIKVWYTDSRNSLKMYMLRCRLRTVEESFRGSSLVRCNRKYIINTGRVKSLRKENEGYFIDMDSDGIPPIPVTKTYVEDILSRFSGKGHVTPAQPDGQS